MCFAERWLSVPLRHIFVGCESKVISRKTGRQPETEIDMSGCYVYILWSEKLGKYYIGSTKRLRNRVKRHNNCLERYTKTGIPWVLVTYRWLRNGKYARVEEVRLKKLKGNREFNKIVNGEVAEWSKAATC